MRASPDSLIRTRLKTGSDKLSADREAREAADHDVLAGRAGEVRAQLLDRLALVLVRVDVRLVEQHDVVHPGLELALGDLGADVLGLVGGLLLEHAQLGVLVGGNRGSGHFWSSFSVVVSAAASATALGSGSGAGSGSSALAAAA